ncbi:DnaT-like ssDNA-binding protein [Pseudomonas mosselii]|uniref:DnaT-like ssDNA-binding protein n=1 Tax=Pseudomonas mosselii TaxID=78327 RepID=UPI001F2A00E5|nr:DnaT-like ssDNA-binding protein [Pseudomonas mosselii]
MDDYYGTVAGADAYHLARGNAAWAAATDEEKQAALVRASGYVDGMVGQQASNATAGCVYVFPGLKAGGYSQALQWPRTGAVDRMGDQVPSDIVPAAIEQATYEAAAREHATPGSLNPDFVPSQVVQREKVGPLEQEFAVAKNGNPSIRPVIGVIDSLLYPLLVVRCPAPAVYVV